MQKPQQPGESHPIDTPADLSQAIPQPQILSPMQKADLFEPAAVLDDLVEIILRYVVMDKEQADAAALWITMTWFIDQIEVAALALITAPEKACGKSQLLTIFSYLVARPLAAANCSISFMFRIIEKDRPTILIDEAETFLGGNGELKGIINAGHTRANAFVGRSETSANGGFEPKRFSVWCAKAFAGIEIEKHLPPATISRSIVIMLRRKMAEEKVGRLRHTDRALFVPLAAKLEKFSKLYAEQVRKAQPPLPEALSDRAQDNWEPLLAIAECAGPAWVERATAAALKLSKSEDASVSTGNELLADIKSVFDSKWVHKITTVDLITYLTEDLEKSWATFHKGKPISPRQLAGLLAAYGIKPRSVRQGPSTPKGYYFSEFKDAFARYLTPTISNDSDVSPQRNTAATPESLLDPDGWGNEDLSATETDGPTPAFTF